MKKSIPALIFLVICLLFLSSCAHEGTTVKQYGFFSGILHGFLFIFSVIGKLFGVDTGLYAVNNTGFFYWLGYLIGLFVLGGAGCSSTRKKTKKPLSSS
ncbi:MAG: hypothetical protein JNN00_16400 [Chitinophagaceae bacterium]|nr:hypothetical protein [Chitinophagaceae bacterium]